MTVTTPAYYNGTKFKDVVSRKRYSEGAWTEQFPGLPATGTQNWYVRPYSASVTYGDESGTDYYNAWNGMDAISTIAMSSGDALHICGTHYEALPEDKIIAGLIITGGVSVDSGIIDGAPEITGSWELYSGNIYRIAVGTQNIDYFQTTPPASPIVGERWLRTGVRYKISSNRARIWTGAKWEEDPDWFFRPHQLWIDGTKYNPSRYPTTGFASADSETQTMTTHTALGGHADDYWKDATIQIKNYNWCVDERIITSSTGNTVSYGEKTYYNTTECMYYYIENVVGEISGFGSWAYKDGYLYVDFDGDLPSAHTVKVSTVNHGIFWKSKNNVRVTGLTIRNTNDAAIMALYSANPTIDNNTLSYINCRGAWLLQNGAVCCMGDDKMVAESNTTEGTYNIIFNKSRYDLVSSKTGLTIQNNVITRVFGCGHGIHVYGHDTGDIDSNTIGYIGVLPGDDSLTLVTARQDAINTEMCDDIDITDNTLSYVANAGIIPYMRNSVISGNFIEYSNLQTYDSGAIHPYGECSYNLTIQNNTIENVVGHQDGYNGATDYLYAIYLDGGGDGTHDITVTGNTIFNVWPCGRIAGIGMNSEDGHVVTDNDFYQDGTLNVYTVFGNDAEYDATTSGNTKYAESAYAG